ncbi:hypothetical protein [Eisenibacter elegans]|uniref:hypothetical protein n=1 Tax=Eisenibacter elegans TaxID=997 RepID=UPI0003F9618B|nr:hypothetical protein [Eisenibacter elegans]
MRAYYFQQTFGELYHDTDKDYYVIAPKGFLNLDKWKQLMTATLKLVETKKFTKALADHRQMEIINQEGQNYIAGEVFPKLFQLGLRCVAVVENENVFSQVTADKVYEQAEQKAAKSNINFQEARFVTIQQAENWLNAAQLAKAI